MALENTPAQDFAELRRRFPGFSPRESFIFAWWFRDHGKEYDRYDYNVRVGDGFDPGPTFLPEYRKMAIANSQKRIDAIGFVGNQPTIIEVKERATMRAVGQLVVYQQLYAKFYPSQPAPKLLIISVRADPDTAHVIDPLGISFVFVKPDFSQLVESARHRKARVFKLFH